MCMERGILTIEKWACGRALVVWFTVVLLLEKGVWWGISFVFLTRLFITGGWRSAEEKGDITGRHSLLLHGHHSREGRRPKHPRAGVLRALLCDRSHHWQAGPVGTQTDRAQWRTDGQRAREDTYQWRRRGCLLGLCWSVSFFFLTFKAISWWFGVKRKQTKAIPS